MARFLVASVGMLALGLMVVPASAFACPGESTEKPAASEQPPAQEAQGALLQDIDVLVADKCSCHSAADCTCKKGQCKCKACKHKRMVEPVKGTLDALKLPTEARWEATSGVFI